MLSQQNINSQYKTVLTQHHNLKLLYQMKSSDLRSCQQALEEKQQQFLKLQYENSKLLSEIQVLKEQCRPPPKTRKKDHSTQTSDAEEKSKNKSIQVLFQQLKNDNESMVIELRRLEKLVSTLREKMLKQRTMLTQKDGVIEGLQKVIEGAM